MMKMKNNVPMACHGLYLYDFDVDSSSHFCLGVRTDIQSYSTQQYS